ncbi:MAG: hypothetical protein AB1736_15570 [Chloroflexota bacterium]
MSVTHEVGCAHDKHGVIPASGRAKAWNSDPAIRLGAFELVGYLDHKHDCRADGQMRLETILDTIVSQQDLRERGGQPRLRADIWWRLLRSGAEALVVWPQRERWLTDGAEGGGYVKQQNPIGTRLRQLRTTPPERLWGESLNTGPVERPAGLVVGADRKRDAQRSRALCRNRR